MHTAWSKNKTTKPYRCLWGVARLCVLALVLWVLPKAALAQQKNVGFAMDGGWEVISASPLPRDMSNRGRIPLRLRDGWQLGAEANYKMGHDKWRLLTRANLHFLKFPGGAAAGTYDFDARNGVGTVLGLEGEVGARYYLWTDKFRPFMQTSISYLRLQHFAGDATDAGLYLPHPNVVSLHVQPGVEFSIRRDVAARIGIDIERWFVWNARGSTMFTLSAGVVLYG